MKCPSCWADKAYRRSESGGRATLLRWLLFVPMRCRHCYHKFWTHRLKALGQPLDAPVKLHTPPPTDQETVAAKYLSQLAEEQDAPRRRRAA